MLAGSGRRITAGQRVDPSKQARALELRRAPMPTEQILWKSSRNRQMMGLHFRRQQVIDSLIVDFYCDNIGLVVEVDGPVHLDQAVYDQERDRLLAARGLRMVRVKKVDVERRFPEVLRRIAAQCEELSGKSSLPISE